MPDEELNLTGAFRTRLARGARELVATVACAIYWFDPIAWLAASRLRAEAEHAADDHVLAAGVDRVTYASYRGGSGVTIRSTPPPTREIRTYVCRASVPLTMPRTSPSLPVWAAP